MTQWPIHINFNQSLILQLILLREKDQQYEYNYSMLIGLFGKCLLSLLNIKPWLENLNYLM